jgi:hypothetical protein
MFNVLLFSSAQPRNDKYDQRYNDSNKNNPCPHTGFENPADCFTAA